MIALLKWLLLVPVALVVIMLAVANRAPVKVIVDPFPPTSENLTFAAPLFLVVLVSVIVGVLIGGAGAWLRQGHNRRTARLAQAEANRQRVEADRLRSQVNAFATLPAPGTSTLA